MKYLLILSFALLMLVAAIFRVQSQETYFNPGRGIAINEAGEHCTRHTCPPGTRVEVDAVRGDTGIALTWDGQVVDLLNLTGMKLVVMSTDGRSPSAWVLSPCNIAYNIKFMFLRKMPSEQRVNEKQKAREWWQPGWHNPVPNISNERLVSSQGSKRHI